MTEAYSRVVAGVSRKHDFLDVITPSALYSKDARPHHPLSPKSLVRIVKSEAMGAAIVD